MVTHEAIRPKLEVIKAKRERLADLDRQITELQRQRSPVASELDNDFKPNKPRLEKYTTDAAALTQDLPLVDVHYEGIREETGKVFDTMHEGNTIFSFEVGKGSVIKAWDFAVKTMKVGEIAKITCKLKYAYGSTDSPPDIPPECMLERIISSFWECKLCWISFS
nr:peptidyl-prolyl cis-trans isomerase FKBP20-1-like [Malus domestica]